MEKEDTAHCLGYLYSVKLNKIFVASEDLQKTTEERGWRSMPGLEGLSTSLLKGKISYGLSKGSLS